MNDDATEISEELEDLLMDVITVMRGKTECRIVTARRFIVSAGQFDCRRGTQTAYCSSARYLNPKCPGRR